MKVLLIDPPHRRWIVMGDYVAPPMGLAHLASVIEEEGHELRLVDCNGSNISWAEVPDIISRIRPQVIGATAFSPFFYDALRVIEIAKRVDSGVTSVLGGPHVTFTCQETLNKYPLLDLIVRGEGEKTIVELLRCLEEKGDLAEVRGIAFGRNKKVIQSPPQSPVDVNQLPLPAYHLLPMGSYRFPVFGRFSTLLTSRGCPYRCSFCSEWDFWGGGWRPREVVSVVDEMELLHRRYGMESFWLGDDCFNIDGERMERLCQEIISRQLSVSWFYQGRADLVIRHQKLLPLMRRAGNLMAQIGVEASTDRELSALNKRLTIEQVREAVRLLKKNHIISQGLIIIGNREDSPGTILHKTRFMKWLDPDFPIFTFLTPFPGSPLYQQAREEGWIETNNFAHYDMSHCIMPTRYLSRPLLSYWYYRCYQSFYLDVVKLLKGFCSLNQWKRRIWRHMLVYIIKEVYRAKVLPLWSKISLHLKNLLP